MKTFKPLLFIFCLWAIIAGCKEDNQNMNLAAEAPVSTFYLIRHAEKDRSEPENIDPELNQKGLGRAMHWAEILEDVSLDAIYSTDFERTTMTAAPTAVKKDITMMYYDPDELDIEQFKANNTGNNVLIVGHSNSTPEFVNKLIGEEKYGPMDDYDNGSLFIVQLTADQVTDIRLHFNCNCPR